MKRVRKSSSSMAPSCKVQSECRAGYRICGNTRREKGESEMAVYGLSPASSHEASNGDTCEGSGTAEDGHANVALCGKMTKMSVCV